MKIKEVAFKNFGSYGNKLQQISFEENTGNFYLIVGGNGAGKSTISDAIKFGLYGRLDNKSIKDIPNRFNFNAYVKIVVEKNPSVIAVIERWVWPNAFKLTINGKEYDQAGKKNVQEFLEEEILGMPYYVFNNIVSLSINDFKSFISMRPADKRLIIDRLFGLEIIQHIRWRVKEKMRRVKDEIDKLDTELSVLERAIIKSNSELEQLNEKLKNAGEEKKATLLTKLSEYNSFVDKAVLRLNEVLEKENEIKNKLQEYREILTEKKHIVETCDEKIRLYQNSQCPVCQSDLHTEFHKGLLHDFVEKSKDAKEAHTQAGELIAKLQEQKTKVSSIKDEVNRKKTQALLQVQMLNVELKSLNENQVNDDQTQSLVNIINDNQQKKDEAIEKKDTETRKVNFYKVLDEIFGDQGVKVSAIKRILPILNAEIKKVTSSLGMDYRVTFNQEFDAEITHLGYKVSVEQLSTGEKKKIDFAVLIALIRLLKIKFHGLNIVFLDEIFSSIDSDGIYHILQILSDASKELSMNIFVINHSVLPTEMFDYRIEIEKNNGFSSFNVTQIN